MNFFFEKIRLILVIIDFFLFWNWKLHNCEKNFGLNYHQYTYLASKQKKSQGLPLSWNSSQFSNWAHKCLSSIFCQEYFMDLYLLAEMKTISLKITTVDMKRPPPDFRSNFEASQPPILIGVHQIVSPMSNSESTNLLTNICYDFLLKWQTEKKLCFWTNKKFVFFFKCSNWEKIRETNWWKHLMNSL